MEAKLTPRQAVASGEWEPGSYGKGFCFKNRVVAWKTDTFGGSPHHSEMFDQHMANPRNGWVGDLYIKPDGATDAWPSQDHSKEEVVALATQLDPRLHPMEAEEEWLLSKVAASLNTMALPKSEVDWIPGNMGAGLVLADGRVLTWNTDESGLPSGKQVTAMQPNHPQVISTFSIAPNGTLAGVPEALAKFVTKADVNLRPPSV